MYLDVSRLSYFELPIHESVLISAAIIKEKMSDRLSHSLLFQFFWLLLLFHMYEPHILRYEIILCSKQKSVNLFGVGF